MATKNRFKLSDGSEIQADFTDIHEAAGVERDAARKAKPARAAAPWVHKVEGAQYLGTVEVPDPK